MLRIRRCTCLFTLKFGKDVMDVMLMTDQVEQIIRSHCSPVSGECLMADCKDPQEHFCFKHCTEVYAVSGDVISREQVEAIKQSLDCEYSDLVGYKARLGAALMDLGLLLRALPAVQPVAAGGEATRFIAELAEEVHARHSEGWLEEVEFKDCTTKRCQEYRKRIAVLEE